MSRADELRGLVDKWRKLDTDFAAYKFCADELEALLTRTEAAPACNCGSRSEGSEDQRRHSADCSNYAAPVVDGAVAEVIDADWGAAFNLLGPMPPIGTKLYTQPQDASERDAERYRWIMDHAGVASYRGNVLVRFELDMQMPSWEGLDWEQVKRDAGSAIDAAMSAKGNENE